MKWNGEVWEEVDDPAVLNEIEKVLVKEWQKAVKAGNGDYKKFLDKLCEPAGYEKLAREIRVRRGKVRSRLDFDADPHVINTPGGVLHLGSENVGQTSPTDPTHLMTKCTGATYLGDDFDFEGTRWQKFLDFVQTDREVQRTMRQHVGLGLVGEAIEQRAVFHKNEAGEKAQNGKSLYHNILRRMFGGYALVAPESLFIGFRSNEFALAQVRGVRWLEVPELPAEGAWNERLYKALVGGDEVSAAFKHKDHFNFHSVCEVSCHTNHSPRLRGGDPGTERRTVCIPWERTISDRQKPKVRALGDQILEKELDVVLTWAVRGLQDYYAAGTLFMPDVVKDASFRLVHEDDPVTEWLDEETEKVPGNVVHVSVLRDAYNRWAERNKREELTPVRFSAHLGSNKIEREGTRGRRAQNRVGIRLTTGQ